MAFSKVILNGTTIMDVTGDTVTAGSMLSGTTAHGANGQQVTGTYTDSTYLITVSYNSQTDMWEPNQTFSDISTAYYDGKALALEYANPSSTSDDILHGLSFVFVEDDPDIGECFYYGVSDLDYSTLTEMWTYYIYNTDGLDIDGNNFLMVKNFETVTKTYTPTTSQQTDTVTFDSTNYNGLQQVNVTVNAMPTGTAGTPTAAKGTVSNHSVSITPSVTNTTGYITGSTKTGTAVSVTASELVSGTKSISQNGTGIDVTNFSAVDVAVPSVDTTLIVTLSWNDQTDMWEPDRTFAEISAAYHGGKNIVVEPEYHGVAATDGEYIDEGGSDDAFIYYVTENTQDSYNRWYQRAVEYALTTNGLESGESRGYYEPELENKTVNPTESQQTITYNPNAFYTGLGTVTVNAISSSYVGSGITRRSSSDLTAIGATVSVPSGYYSNSASKSVTSMTLPTELTNSASGTQKATLTVDNGSIYHYLQIPAGYNATNSFYNIQAKTGSATTPATTITANPSISVSSGGLITATASASQSVTPTISAGYVSSGTAGTVTVNGSNTSQLSTQAATTITPTESAQTAVAAGKYTTGAVTVGAISSTYVGSGITQRDSSDMAFNPQIQSVVAPAGYYAAQSTYQVSSGTAGTPTATKGTVSNHSVTVTPSVTNTTGYILGSTINGTGVTVSASELVSGSQTITENGTFDVTNLSQVLVNAGLEYETGTYTPTSDIARPTISFAKTHTTTPFLVMMVETISTAYSISNNSNVAFYFFDVYRAFSEGYPYNTSTSYPAFAQYLYRSNSTNAQSTSHIQYNSDNTGASSTAYSRYWVTESEFHPYSNSTSRYWRSGRTYKWYAIWK